MGNQGEVLSPLSGEIRIQSDSELSRDARTACEWQSFVSECLLRRVPALAPWAHVGTTDNEAKMRKAFKAAMAKLAVVGQDISQLVDCSEVIPEPEGYSSPAYFPNGTTYDDIQQACAATPFPSLASQPVSATSK